MKYMVKKSFAGTPVSGHAGKELNIENEKVAADLLKAGYIEPAKEKGKKNTEEKKNEDW